MSVCVAIAATSGESLVGLLVLPLRPPPSGTPLLYIDWHKGSVVGLPALGCVRFLVSPRPSYEGNLAVLNTIVGDTEQTDCMSSVLLWLTGFNGFDVLDTARRDDETLLWRCTTGHH
jgi:hypothetical protein